MTMREEKEHHQKLIVGLVLIVIVCTSQVGSAFTSKFAIQRLHAGPFFLMWIHTLTMILMYPLGCLLIRMSTSTRCRWWCKHTYATTTTTTRNDGDLVIVEQARQQKTQRMFYRIIILFYPLWIIANYCYAAALRYVSASTMVSIFGSCTAFVSLGERQFFGVVAYGFIMQGMGGTGTGTGPTTTTTTSTNNNIGVLLGTLSSIAAATYKVAFKKYLGSPTTMDVCLFLSILGIVNLVTPYNSSIEEIPSFYNNNHDDESTTTTTYQSWGIILGGSILILIFNSSIAFGIAITSPLFIAVGTALAIPVTDIIDYYFVNNTGDDNNVVSFGPGQIIASISIIASFVLMTLDQYLIILGDGESVSDVDDHDFAITAGVTTTIGNHPNGSDDELRSMIITSLKEYDQASLAYIVYIVDCAGRIPWEPIERPKDQYLYEARDVGTKHWLDSKDCPLDDGMKVFFRTAIEFRIENKIQFFFGSNTIIELTEKDFEKNLTECILLGSLQSEGT
ncbi:hypothetical protein FRACYDRAFT_251019 [Fragilariopsis cylindrus CCMP1102]|uniref:EamA domain-containing protein n=1 Tax=Fragilariopsis cylindrus CCMP1102 TaxID=635003 RepID=A0A1E7ENQ3_9STRA|nr:hypothetical protein FRACYDRAFT_251019 [Fragilariopsis cylindrus CCMP1102]|eukprot:OEU07599.1 hypothetical protein FRACYDRAFT_251019 [Fragilariopsis cylindrus CCMP1102]